MFKAGLVERTSSTNCGCLRALTKQRASSSVLWVGLLALRPSDVRERKTANIIVCREDDFLRQADSLQKAEADDIFAGGGEVALAMTDSLLRDLGGTQEQPEEFQEQLRSKLIYASEGEGDALKQKRCLARQYSVRLHAGCNGTHNTRQHRQKSISGRGSLPFGPGSASV